MRDSCKQTSMSDSSNPSAIAYSVLHIDQDFVAVDKPEGHFVHPPEDRSQRRFVRPEKVVLSNLRRQLGLYLYPVHRLDVATSGVLLFALSKEKAAEFAKLHSLGRVEKTYHLVCRGWTEDQFCVDLPLELDSTGALAESRTEFESLARIELGGLPAGKYPTSRYSLLRATPVTGRYHQIRRHLNRISHPIIGDNDHGDSRYNRFFRENYGIQGLCLRAVNLKLRFHDDSDFEAQAPQNLKWQLIEKLMRPEAPSCSGLAGRTSNRLTGAHHGPLIRT